MVEVQDLYKRYGDKEAVAGISFTAPSGQVLGLLGLNGAGKSTTMNIITGCLAPSSGSVFVDGLSIMEEPARAKGKIGYLPEIPPLYVDMTVWEYLHFVCGIKKITADEKTHLAEICARTGLSHVNKRLIRNLSKGYRQRVGLAAALIGNPGTLILDEPTVGLDPTQVVEIRELISEIGKENTVILSSHILSEIQAVCQRVIVIHQGRIIADGEPDTIHQTNYRSIVEIEGEPDTVTGVLSPIEGVSGIRTLGSRECGVYEYEITCAPALAVKRRIFFALAEAGLPMLSSRHSQGGLEDMFLDLVKEEEGVYEGRDNPGI